MYPSSVFKQQCLALFALFVQFMRSNQSLIWPSTCNILKSTECDSCGYQSDRKSNLMRHIEICQGTIETFSRSDCKYSSNNKQNLQRHESSCKNKDFSCVVNAPFMKLEKFRSENKEKIKWKVYFEATKKIGNVKLWK